MRARCHNERHARYADYGGRGIRVCDEWRASFEAFLAYMGPRPSDAHTLERPNNDRGYEPGNCVWATRTEQNRNQRRNRVVTYQGRSMTLAEASRLAGLPEVTVSGRLHRGWSVDRALTEAVWSKSKARRSPIMVTYQDREMPLVEACRIAGLPYPTIAARLKAGMDASSALNTPVHGLRKSKI